MFVCGATAGEADFPALEYTSSAPAGLEGDARCRVFQGGRYVDLHKMLGVKSGSEAGSIKRSLQASTIHCAHDHPAACVCCKGQHMLQQEPLGGSGRS